MLGDECLEVSDQSRVSADCELGVEQVFLRRGAQLLEAGDLDLREGLERQVGQRSPAPEPQGFA